MPAPEALLWSKLKGKQLKGFKFRRQYGVGNYILDFYCPTRRLAIEIDGDSHYIGDAHLKDLERQRIIAGYNISFLRFTNREVMDNITEVIQIIGEALG